MDAKTLLNILVDDSQYKKSEIARILNLKPQVLNTRLTRSKSPRVASVVDILDVLGYQLVVTKKGVKLPTDAVIIDEQEDEELDIEKYLSRQDRS